MNREIIPGRKKRIEPQMFVSRRTAEKVVR